MLTLIFLIVLFGVCGKLLLFALKAAWGLAQIILTVVFLPLILVGMVIGGLIEIAVPILIIFAVVTLIYQAVQEA